MSSTAGARTEGYWATLGFEKASVDFCEGNFEQSYYVAEPVNTLSSVPFVLLGLFGLLSANFARGAKRGGWEHAAFAGSYALIAAIGIGSMALHATLIAPGQASDEVPMIFMNQILVFIICNLRASSTLPPWQPRIFGAVGVGTVAIYARYRAFYTSFLAVYITSFVCIIIPACARLAFQPRQDPLGERARTSLLRPLFIYAVTSAVVPGTVAWVVEFNYCKWVSRVLGPAFLHPLWHTGAQLGAWLCIQFLSAARISACGQSPQLRWHWGLPITVYPPPNEITK
ncbi:ceramidase [Baffinella frigidus]|nr:ceramidase [Cryptophyta sp. CCMP2293]